MTSGVQQAGALTGAVVLSLACSIICRTSAASVMNQKISPSPMNTLTGAIDNAPSRPRQTMPWWEVCGTRRQPRLSLGG